MLRKSSRQYAHVQNGEAQRLARKVGLAAPMPPYDEPLLATKGRSPKGTNWVHEISYDGYRFQLYLKNSQPTFLTRRGYDWTDKVKTLVGTTAHLNTQLHHRRAGGGPD